MHYGGLEEKEDRAPGPLHLPGQRDVGLGKSCDKDSSKASTPLLASRSPAPGPRRWFSQIRTGSCSAPWQTHGRLRVWLSSAIAAPDRTSRVPGPGCGSKGNPAHGPLSKDGQLS